MYLHMYVSSLLAYIQNKEKIANISPQTNNQSFIGDKWYYFYIIIIYTIYYIHNKYYYIYNLFNILLFYMYIIVIVLKPI